MPDELVSHKTLNMYKVVCVSGASLVARMIKKLPAMRDTWVRSLSWEDPLQEGMATHSSILAWRIPNGQKGCKELDMTEQLTLVAATGGGESLTSPVSTELGSPGTFPAA